MSKKGEDSDRQKSDDDFNIPWTKIPAEGLSAARDQKRPTTESGESSAGRQSSREVKRMKFTSMSSNAAAQLFADNDEKMEMIRLKGHAKMLESRVSALERELEERHIRSEREKSQQEMTKNTLEARVSSLERELSFITERERQAKDRASKAEKLLHEDRAKAEARLMEIAEEKREAEQALYEQHDRLQGENQTLHANYMEERRQAADLRQNCAQLQNENSNLKRRNLELTEELKICTDQLSLLRASNQVLQDEFNRFREDCVVAMTMREEMLQFKTMKQENAVLKKQVERYKATSENTMLLKEQNLASEERVGRLQAIQEQLAVENSELKAAIAKTAETLGHQLSFGDLDELSRHCVDLKNENQMLYQEVQRVQEELNEKAVLVAQYEAEWEARTSNMELTLAERDEMLQVTDTRCAEFDEVIAQKDEIIQQLQTNANEMYAQYLRDQEEKAELLKRLSPSVGVAECQTENGNTDLYAYIDQLKKSLEEKDLRIGQLETRFGLMLDYNPSTTRILHIEDNPLSAARKEYMDRVKAVESENHMLKVRLQELERVRRLPRDSSSDEMMDEDVTTKVSLRLNMEQLDAERNDLMEKVRKLEEEKQRQKERMKEVHQNVTREYREMVTLLTGFQLKMKEGGLYVVQSIYEKEREHYFLVQRGQGNEINLLENQYTPRWMDFVETYLMTDHSIPAFLAAVTLNLYESKDDKGASVSYASYGGTSTSASA